MSTVRKSLKYTLRNSSVLMENRDTCCLLQPSQVYLRHFLYFFLSFLGRWFPWKWDLYFLRVHLFLLLTGKKKCLNLSSMSWIRMVLSIFHKISSFLGSIRNSRPAAYQLLLGWRFAGAVFSWTWHLRNSHASACDCNEGEGCILFSLCS